MSVSTHEHQYGRAWSGNDNRGFWTKRRRTATSLLVTIGLIAGIAVAFKLFDREVPNNVVRDASVFAYDVLKKDAALGENNFTSASGTNPIFFTGPAGPEMFPGDTRTVDVKIVNENVPERDASFEVYIKDIVVRDNSTGTPVVILTTDPRWNRFVSFWTFSVDKQVVVTSVFGDVTTSFPTERFSPACSGGLREITANSPCALGLIRARGDESLLGEPTDERLYRFKMTEADDGTDQSEFKGWEVVFTLVFNARVPAVPESVLLVGER